MNRRELIKKIEFNIDKNGQHITIVSGSQEPRYAYTIGLHERFNIELILAGGIVYLEQEVYSILNTIAEKIGQGSDLNSLFALGSLGDFTLTKVDSSWSEITMLGVYDYYNTKEINAYQVIPDKRNITIDVPDMSKVWSSAEQPAWKWLKENWTYNVSNNVTVVTNLGALKGKPITEIMRWEKEEWEMFSSAGPEVDKEDMRVVPLGLLLSMDQSLISALDLKIGKGMWREGISSGWNAWG